MQQTNSTRFPRVLFVGSLALSLLVGTLVPSTLVSAQDNQVQVLVGDVCPNIPGNQPTIPSGMQIDSNGDCFTPTPPIPDVCPNLDGPQNAIPNGYYRNQNGNCVTQTTPPKDVCPNISGTQSTIPNEMTTGANGDCVQPSTDSCPNIPGPQSTLPKDMKHDDAGNCFTPPVTPVTPPEQPTKPEDVPLVRSAPFDLMPYYPIGALFVVSVFLLTQMLRESLATNGIIILFKRRKRLAEDKDQFIELSKHYIRTTLELMVSDLSSLIPAKEVAEKDAEPLLNTTRALQVNTEAVFSDRQGDSQENTDSLEAGVHVKTLLSPLLWIPSGLTVLITITINILLTPSSTAQMLRQDLWVQAIALVIAYLTLFFTLRARHIRHIKRRYTEKLAENEHSIDAARTDFIEKSATVLGTGLASIDLERQVIATAASDRPFNNGYDHLQSLLTKFNLLQKITANANGATKFDIRGVIDNCLFRYQNQLDEKKLTITDTVEKQVITQNRELFDFVLGSVIDNAVKFNVVGGNLSITTTAPPHGYHLELRITSTGEGISEEKRASLFRPIYTDREVGGELGLSLFLDKIIMDYIGGQITIDPSTEQQTTIVLRA